MHVILSIVYMLVGVLLAVPYCILAGWDPESFMGVAFVAPAFLIVWLMVATFAGVIEPGGGHRGTIRVNWSAAFGKNSRWTLPDSLPMFWAWTLYSLSPIILHRSAMLLGKFGYERVGAILDSYRYTSLFFMTTLVSLAFVGMVRRVHRR